MSRLSMIQRVYLFAFLSLVASLVWAPGPASFSVSSAELNLPEAQTFANTSTFNQVVPDGNGAVLSGFTGDVRAVLSVSSGLLRIGGSSTYASNTLTVGSVSVDVPNGYRYADIASGGDGRSELAFEGSSEDVNTVLAELEFSRSTAGSSSLSVSAVKASSSGNVAYDPDTGHYYEFVSTTKMWRDARCAAKFDGGRYASSSSRFDKCDEDYLTPRTFNGYSGYLATITSGGENDFATNKAGRSAAWIGGSDAATTRLEGSEVNISATEQNWRWVDGPEAGLIFWVTGCTNNGTKVTSCSGADASTQFSYWNSGEPNHYGTGEEATQILSGDSGNWNDLAEDSNTLPFIVEYGGLEGESAEEEVDASVALSVALDGPPTGVTPVAGDASASLSWTAPVIVTGTTVTSYTVTSTPDSATCTTTRTSCTVDGLANGTSYTFAVEVTFANSNTRTSASSSSIIPLASLGSSGSPSDDDDDGDEPAPGLSPSDGGGPPIVIPRRGVTPPQDGLPVTRQGPVLRNGESPVPPKAPTVVLGGKPTLISTSVLSTTQLDVKAGRLSLGVKVLEDQGTISEAPDGTTQIAVKKGASATITGSGFRPAATVQVFLPLDGDNAKELTRIPVAADGSFDGSAPFATKANEAPLPVGKQVLQLVSLDNDGNQVVVEMTVNIAQGAPAPEANRIEGVIPVMQPGQSIATSGGEPIPVTITPVSDQKLAVVEGDGWTMAVNVNSDQGGVEPSEGGALLKLVRNESAMVSGSGFMAGTRADVWLFSDPTLLGTVTIDENGEFSGEVNIDPNMIPVGQHTLQLQGVGEDGYVKAANMGVLVDDPAEAVTDTATASLTFLWWIIAAVLAVLVLVVILASRRRRQA